MAKGAAQGCAVRSRPCLIGAASLVSMQLRPPPEHTRLTSLAAPPAATLHAERLTAVSEVSTGSSSTGGSVRPTAPRTAACSTQAHGAASRELLSTSFAGVERQWIVAALRNRSPAATPAATTHASASAPYASSDAPCATGLSSDSSVKSSRSSAELTPSIADRPAKDSKRAARLCAAGKGAALSGKLTGRSGTVRRQLRGRCSFLAPVHGGPRDHWVRTTTVRARTCMAQRSATAVRSASRCLGRAQEFDVAAGRGPSAATLRHRKGADTGTLVLALLAGCCAMRRRAGCAARRADEVVDILLHGKGSWAGLESVCLCASCVAFNVSAGAVHHWLPTRL